MQRIELEFRKHLQNRDIHFIGKCLGRNEQETAAITQLLYDTESVDQILDQPELLHTLLSSCEHLDISTRLYFYLLTRHSFKKTGLEDADLADYVSGILDLHTSSYPTSGSHRYALFYAIDLIKEIERTPPERHRQLYINAGNQLLFATGIFPNYFAKRTQRRGAPNIEFYEHIGSVSFERAAERRTQEQTKTNQIYKKIAECFSEIRNILNEISENFMFLDPSNIHNPLSGID